MISLVAAVVVFLDDIFWDETGDGSAVAIFSPDQINSLHDALSIYRAVGARTIHEAGLCETCRQPLRCGYSRCATCNPGRNREVQPTDNQLTPAAPKGK